MNVSEHKSRSEPWTLERALEVAGAADQETLDAEEADALRWLTKNAYDLGLRVLALDAAARRVLTAPQGTSQRQVRFWLMDALGDSWPGA